MVNYTVYYNNCTTNTSITANQVIIAMATLSDITKTILLGYKFDGTFASSPGTTIVTTTQTTDPKLWIIGAVLGPIAFVVLLIALSCFLYFKCRPRTTNQSTAQVY
jgi:hypothetical protein